MSKPLIIKNGRIIDPRKRDGVGDLIINDGKLGGSAEAAYVLDTTGMVVCPGFIDLHCHLRQPGFEEKETDVAIAVKMLELVQSGRVDSLVLMSGDTDLCPAVDGVRRMSPSVGLRVAFPYQRYNKDLDQRADGRFRISPRLIAASQFSDPYVLMTGRIFQKPPIW